MIEIPKPENDMPPMDALGGAMGQDPNMMNGAMGMEQDPNMMGSEEGFDAKVEADPTEDPKKYIQQLSGKLSQELRKYNNEQGQPDEELNKYVAGMIIPQASQGLTDKGKKEIIGKIKKGVTDDTEEAPTEEEPQEPMPMESRKYRKNITEIMNQIFDDSKKQEERQEKKVNKQIKNRNPFVSNR